jgi:hypothetical protein
VLGSAGISLLDAKHMTFTEAAVCLGRDISPEDRAMLQRLHSERRERAKLPPGQRPTRGSDTPEIQQTSVKDEAGKVRRFEKGVAADR